MNRYLDIKNVMDSYE